jgi:hypothetical protein
MFFLGYALFEVPGAIIVSAGADENGWRES